MPEETDRKNNTPGAKDVEDPDETITTPILPPEGEGLPAEVVIQLAKCMSPPLISTRDGIAGITDRDGKPLLFGEIKLQTISAHSETPANDEPDYTACNGARCEEDGDDNSNSPPPDSSSPVSKRPPKADDFRYLLEKKKKKR
jgi:hypothetical protein